MTSATPLSAPGTASPNSGKAYSYCQRALGCPPQCARNSYCSKGSWCFFAGFGLHLRGNVARRCRLQTLCGCRFSYCFDGHPTADTLLLPVFPLLPSCTEAAVWSPSRRRQWQLSANDSSTSRCPALASIFAGRSPQRPAHAFRCREQLGWCSVWAFQLSISLACRRRCHGPQAMTSWASRSISALPGLPYNVRPHLVQCDAPRTTTLGKKEKHDEQVQSARGAWLGHTLGVGRRPRTFI